MDPCQDTDLTTNNDRSSENLKAGDTRNGEKEGNRVIRLAEDSAIRLTDKPSDRQY